jgi:DNA gyrase subunit B
VLEGEELKKVVELLNKLEELLTIVRRRGIDFADFLAKRDSTNGHLPRFHVVIDGEDFLLHDVTQRDELLAERNLVVESDPALDAVATNGKQKKDGPRLQKNHEMHEVKDLEKLFTQLEAVGLSIDDYFLTQEESVTGEKLATKYALRQEGTQTEVAGVAQLLPEIHKLGKHGIEVKRFKGLGEMNAEQLWETTLDQSKRVLLRVTLQEAAEAERMFSVLMGEDVERRRQFIEDHALEVKNLDV